MDKKSFITLGPGGKFHNHFTTSFFVRKFFAQLLCAYNLGLSFFGKRILAQKAAHKMLVKLTPGRNFIIIL
jgi:hypothetical protein